MSGGAGSPDRARRVVEALGLALAGAAPGAGAGTRLPRRTLAAYGRRRMERAPDAPTCLADVAWRPPPLETERVLLRGWEDSDADAVFAYASDAEVARYMSWERHRTIAPREISVPLGLCSVCGHGSLLVQ